MVSSDPPSRSCPPVITDSGTQQPVDEVGLRSGSPVAGASLYCSQLVLAWHFLTGYLTVPLVITVVHLCY